MEEIYNSDKICIKHDAYNRQYAMDIYDKHGHYVDEIMLNYDEMRELVNGLPKF